MKQNDWMLRWHMEFKKDMEMLHSCNTEIEIYNVINRR